MLYSLAKRGYQGSEEGCVVLSKLGGWALGNTVHKLCLKIVLPYLTDGHTYMDLQSCTYTYSLKPIDRAHNYLLYVKSSAGPFMAK